MKYAYTIVCLIVGFFAPQFAQGTVEFDVQYLDSNGEGFFSATPAAPIGENTGSTLGEQRRIAFEFALNQFGQRLDSSIPIHIEADFQSYGGTINRATLASAGPEWYNYNFPGAPQSNIAYPSALANKISGLDLSNESLGRSDIAVTINEDVDGTALGTTTFYYGLDGRGQSRDVDFVTVISHELMHGLGFLSAIDPLTGHKFGCSEESCRTNDLADIFSLYLSRHNQSGTTPLLSMSQTQRLSAVTAENEVIWTGSAGQKYSQDFFAGTLDGAPLIHTPASLELGSTLSHTARSLAPVELMQPTYSGFMQLSKLSMAMLSDLGWGQAGDLEISLRQSANDTGEFISAVTNTGTSSAAGVSVSIATTNGTLSVIQGTGCNRVSAMELRCELGTVSAGQNTAITAQVENQTSAASLTASVAGSLLEFNPEDNTASLALSPPTTNQDTAPTTTTVVSATSTSTPQTPRSSATTPASEGGGSIGWITVLLIALCRQTLLRSRSLTTR